jgi:hypothetical protein
VQVKDILIFAPQLRSNPALSNPNDIWNFNIVGSGTANRLYFETLQFAGLQNTQVDAQGTLSGLMNPADAGGNFTIHKLHTSQTDIALFTGQRLSNAQLNLPETFDIRGTINGNAGRLITDLDVNTSAGFMTLNGSFAHLTNPATASYHAAVKTNGLRLGTILRQPDQIGSVSGNFIIDGKGLTPNTINTKFRGAINSLGYNNYQYHNIHINGSLNGSSFSATADVNDANADLNLTASGNFANNLSFKIDGMIDSIKTLPLHFSTQPLIFRGQINGTVANLNPDYLDADILITKALLVSGTERLALDTVQLISGRTDTANYIRLYSDIINAQLTGQYRLADLGNIIQSSIQPYFSVTPPAKRPDVQPYNFRFSADVVYSPILSTFVPNLTAMEPIHAEGSFITNEGMIATLTTPYLSFSGNEMTDLNVRANTSDSGLRVSANAGHFKSGNSFDLYNTRINATALNNSIDFNLGIDDVNAKNKYYLSGTITQPSQGAYTLSLRPDSLLMNYEKWTIAPNNSLTIGTTNITADNFVLQKGTQRLSVESLTGSGSQPLQLSFTDFRLATLTGFVKSDSLLVDGVMNGNVIFRNILQQPVFTSNLTINDLSLRQDTIGNVNLQVRTGNANNYITNVSLTGRGNDATITGSLTPQGNLVLLDLDLAVRQLQLNTMEGAMATAITNASGTVNGDIKIRGSLTNPDIAGDLHFNKTSFALTLLGSQFFIDNETRNEFERHHCHGQFHQLPF